MCSSSSKGVATAIHPSMMPLLLVTRKTMSASLSGTAIISLTFTDYTPGAHQFWNRTKAQLPSTQFHKD